MAARAKHSCMPGTSEEDHTHVSSTILVCQFQVKYPQLSLSTYKVQLLTHQLWIRIKKGENTKSFNVTCRRLDFNNFYRVKETCIFKCRNSFLEISSKFAIEIVKCRLYTCFSIGNELIFVRRHTSSNFVCNSKNIGVMSK